MRCDHCGDVIGSYEPLIVVIGAAARETSLTSEPTVHFDVRGERYHGACYLDRMASGEK